MIERKNTINPSADCVQITFSYSRADVRQWMRIFNRQASGNDFLLEDEARKLTMAEANFVRWLCNLPEAFYNIERPWSVQLSRWAFAQAVKLGYLVEAEGKPGHYRLTDKTLKLK